MVVEIDGGAFLVGSGDDSETVHFMLDGLPFLHYLHNFLLDYSVQKSGSVRISFKRRPSGAGPPETTG